MTIETKYNIGDKVWYIHEYKVVCGTGDAEDYIDFIRCKTIEEYDKRRIR